MKYTGKVHKDREREESNTVLNMETKTRRYFADGTSSADDDDFQPGDNFLLMKPILGFEKGSGLDTLAMRKCHLLSPVASHLGWRLRKETNKRNTYTDVRC